MKIENDDFINITVRELSLINITVRELSPSDNVEKSVTHTFYEKDIANITQDVNGNISLTLKNGASHMFFVTYMESLIFSNLEAFRSKVV